MSNRVSSDAAKDIMECIQEITENISNLNKISERYGRTKVVYIPDDSIDLRKYTKWSIDENDKLIRRLSDLIKEYTDKFTVMIDHYVYDDIATVLMKSGICFGEWGKCRNEAIDTLNHIEKAYALTEETE